MKIQMESTTKIVELRTPSGIVPARVWEGVTDSGIACQVFVTRIAVDKQEDTTQFEKELQEHRAPMTETEAWPLRMVL